MRRDPGTYDPDLRQRTRGGGFIKLVQKLNIYPCLAKTCACVNKHHISNTNPLAAIYALLKEEYR